MFRMMRSSLFLFLFFTAVSQAHAVHYASSVISFTPGTGTDDTNGDQALGAPGGGGCSLGDNGTLILGFATAYNGNGVDVRVTELGPDADGYTVYASEDGGATFPHNLGSSAGATDFSLPSNVISINAIKIVDDNIHSSNAPVAGADIDAVKLYHSSIVISQTLMLTALQVPPENDPNNMTGPPDAPGVRTFAEGDAVAPATLKDKMIVKIQIVPSVPNTTIYLRSYDVDDPSSSLVIDPNDASQANNPNDNIGTSPNPRGQFTNNSSDQTTVTTDAAGLATAEFQVTKQPGDNFRVGASLSNDLPATFSASAIPSARRTKQLTVWRTLHVELDQMAAYSVSENEVDGTVDVRLSPTVLEVNTALRDEYSSFQNGTITINSIDYTVSTNSVNAFLFDDTIAISPPPYLPVTIDGQPFHLKDDDSNFGLVPFPALDLSVAIPAFAEAYVNVVRNQASTDNNVVFDRNTSDIPFNLTSSTNEQKDLSCDEQYWSCLMLSGFQFWYEEDDDPDTNEAILGSSSARANDGDAILYGYGNYGMVALEVMREHLLKTGHTTEARTTAHEIGHQFGLSGVGQHSTMLMATKPLSDSFNTADIRAIRSVKQP